MKTQDEAEEFQNRVLDMYDKAQRKGSKYPGMTYEQGLREAVDWIMEDQEDDPTQD